MIALALLLLQTSQAPVLAFPEAGVDDTAAYQGYQTRFYRDAKGNTVQIYLDRAAGRIVHLWADAADESLGFSARDARGRPAALTWAADSALVADSGAVRTLEYRLAAGGPVTLGWFVLGSMRVERDFQYAKAHVRPFTARRFYVAEESLLVANVARLPQAERRRQLALLGAPGVTALKARLQPVFARSCSQGRCVVRVTRPSLDGRNRLTLEIRPEAGAATVEADGRTVSVRSPAGAPVTFTVRIATDGAALTPLPRDSIFRREFLDFLARVKASDPDPMRGRRLEREMLGVELLGSEEKLMAGLPNFATYFGRDMLMTALMMGPIWRPGMSEHVIASVLRKLSPRGDVSHEEALGGQAIRENAAAYNALMARRAMREARALLTDLQRTRENYHMLDDELQLPILEARYLGDTSVAPARKREFLLAAGSGDPSRAALMLRELALVARETLPYARDPRPGNLIGFVKRDSTHWRSSSWRDSDAGYANGRFAMDINAIWAPRALEATARILAALPRLGISGPALDSLMPDSAAALRAYVADSAALRRAVDTWRGARRHFEVTLAPADIARHVRGKLAELPEAERRYWGRVVETRAGASDSLRFLALALDSAGRPIPVVNTDPATELFLDASAGAIPALDQLGAILRPFPVGLFVDGLGPVAANDAYAARRVRETFAADAYHSPRVVWGREVNLLLLGLATVGVRATAARESALLPSLRPALDALRRTTDAVRASGLEHSELWSYRIEADRLQPTRYGAGSDVQLWSTTDLAVQFMMSRILRR